MWERQRRKVRFWGMECKHLNSKLKHGSYSQVKNFWLFFPLQGHEKWVLLLYLLSLICLIHFLMLLNIAYNQIFIPLKYATLFCQIFLMPYFCLCLSAKYALHLCKWAMANLVTTSLGDAPLSLQIQPILAKHELSLFLLCLS